MENLIPTPTTETSPKKGRKPLYNDGGVLVAVKISTKTSHDLDYVRGNVPRATYLRQIIEVGIQKQSEIKAEEKEDRIPIEHPIPGD